jgi:hypothetical protein
MGHLTLDTSVEHLTSNISNKTANTDKRETKVISERETVQDPENYLQKRIEIKLKVLLFRSRSILILC